VISLCMTVDVVFTGGCQTCHHHVSQLCTQFLAQHGNSPKSRLNTPNVVFPPISPCHLLLPHRHPLPHYPHHSDLIPLILIKPNLQSRIMAFDPLRQSPLLHNQRRFFQLNELATDVAAKDLEFTADMRAFKELRRCTCKGSETFGGGESGVKFRGRGAEFFGVVNRGGVNG